MKIRFGVLLLALLMVCGAFTGCSKPQQATEKVVLKVHHAQPTVHPFDEDKQHPYQEGAEKLAALVAELSGGTLEIEIYPANALGEDEEVMELMQSGIVDMSLVMPVSKAAANIPDLEVFNFPFLFVSEEHGQAFAQSPEAQTLLDKASEHNLVGLGFSTFLFRYPMNSVKEITSVEDFKGLKLRTMSTPAALDAFAELGANTVSIPFGELYSSLQLGTIDGVENDLLTLLGQNYHEVAKHLSLVPIWPFASITLMSQDTWNKLSDEHQAVLKEAIPQALKVIDEEYANSLSGAIEMLKENGVIVSEPANVQEFVNAVQPVYDKHLPALTEEQQAIVQSIIALGASY